MTKNNVAFTAENIMSSLGMKVDDTYKVNFERDAESCDVTSRLSIENKNHRHVLLTDNFENATNPGFMGLVKTNMTPDGIVSLAIYMESQDIKDIMVVVNHYVKLFLCITKRTLFMFHEYLELEINATYSQDLILPANNSLNISLEDIKIANLKLTSPFETNICNKTIDLDYFVECYLNKIDPDLVITTDTNITELLELVKTQLIIDAMVDI